MIRKATRVDIPRIMEIRSEVRENRLRDPSRVTIEDVSWFVDNAGIFVWEEDGAIQGFSAADPREGSIFALFVHPSYERRGIGRALLPLACAMLRESGHTIAELTTETGTRAERLYRLDGWVEVGRKEDGQVVLKKSLLGSK